MYAGIVEEEECTFELDFCLDRTRTSCLPVARRAATIDLPRVGDVPACDSHTNHVVASSCGKESGRDSAVNWESKSRSATASHDNHRHLLWQLCVVISSCKMESSGRVRQQRVLMIMTAVL